MQYALHKKLGFWESTLHQHRKWNFQDTINCNFDNSAKDSTRPSPSVQWQLNSTIKTMTKFHLGNFRQPNLDPNQCISVFPGIFPNQLQIKLSNLYTVSKHHDIPTRRI